MKLQNFSFILTTTFCNALTKLLEKKVKDAKETYEIGTKKYGGTVLAKLLYI